MKKYAACLVVFAALAFGLGAFSLSLVEELRADFVSRSYRELVNRDLIAGVSPSGARYFEGRADGFRSVSLMNYAEPNVAEYLRGYGEAVSTAAVIIEAAAYSGEVIPPRSN